MLANQLRGNRVLVLAFVIHVTEYARLDQVQIRQIQLVQFFRDIAEERFGIAVGHVAPRAARAKAHGHTFAAPHRDDGLSRFDQKARTVFERTAVDIGALVAAVLQELVDK